MRTRTVAALAVGALLLFAAPARCQDEDDDDAEPEVEEEAAASPKLGPVAVPVVDAGQFGAYSFLESFGEGWKQRWIASTDPKYSGVATVAEADGTTDPGLLLADSAMHYGVSALVSPALDPSNGVVLQFEMTLTEGLDCGGAYLKFMTESEDFDQLTFHGEAPYTIMFGPDKCGNTNKVHVIFRHKSPKDGSIEEKHLQSPVTFPLDKKAHLYTLVVKPDNTYAVAIDNEVKVEGSLFEDFQPPFNPPEEIDDPNDKKPADWVEEEEIEDASASKPDDWDESEPPEVDDMDAEKPEGWLDAEPDTIDDPEAVKPEDWDDEDDGEWEPPKIENPKCDEAPGCGPWVRPKKPNAKYKGTWVRPMVPNPAYKGVWAPRKIPNPKHFKDPTPLKHIGKIGGVGAEIWTMTGGIVFDNILVTASEEVAEQYGDATWQVKFDGQVQQEIASRPMPKQYAPPFLVPQMRELLASPTMDQWRVAITPIVDWLEQNPLALYAGLGSAPVLFVLSLFFCCGRSAAEEEEEPHPKKTDAATADDDEEGEEAEPAEDEAKGGARRRTRRAD